MGVTTGDARQRAPVDARDGSKRWGVVKWQDTGLWIPHRRFESSRPSQNPVWGGATFDGAEAVTPGTTEREMADGG